jgi:hypothetical protein
MGKQIFDCSGLIVWALQQLELISATDDYNTDGLLGLCTRLKDRSQLQPGDLVFGGNGNSTWHVGVYVGDGLTVQAECTAIGVVKTNWEQFNSWSMYGRLKCLKGEEVNNMDSIIKIGDVGSAVIELQEKLNTFGYNLIVDGDFGKATQTAVISFQQSRGLMADGIVGSCTQQALQQNGNNIEQPQEQPEPEVDWKKKYEDLLNQYYEMRQGLIDIINKYI